MMELLIPLGLLGLLGIVALIIIYIIKPNYQTKHVTSTYVWKLSLRYRKKRPPTSNIRNILIFICQVLILSSMAFILAWPAINESTAPDGADVVYILDSSASMYAETDNKTRFDVAVEEVLRRAGATIDGGGRASVIVADDEPYFLGRRVDSTRKLRLSSDIEALAEAGASYTVADIEGALVLAKEILLENPNAELYLFTDTKYTDVPSKLHVEVVRDGVVRDLSAMGGEEGSEWNAAILGATAVRENGWYTVSVQIACYGASMEIPLLVNVEGAAGSGKESFSLGPVYVECDSDRVKTVVFRYDAERKEEDDTWILPISANEHFSSYKALEISLDSIDDSYPIDDHFSLYGGQKQRLEVQYYSSDPNPFLPDALGTVQNAISSRYELSITEVKKGGVPATEGFDFYIFEHVMPETLPTDGAILLADPDPRLGVVPVDAGFTVDSVESFRGNSFSLAEGEDYDGHPVMRNINADEITVSEYDVIKDFDPSYRVLLSIDGNPLFLVRNEPRKRIAVMSFSIHFTNLSKLPENFLIMYNLFDYFFPPIVSGNAFEAGEEFTLDSWGEELTFSGSDAPFKAEDLPMAYSIERPGSYTFTQKTYAGKNERGEDKYEDITIDVFIKPPAAESDIRKTEDGLDDPYEEIQSETVYRDLLIFLASALVALLFLEWWLQSRENK